MTVWILFGLMSLLAALILARPLFWTRKWRNDSDSAFAIYRDQLAELARDERNGLIAPEAARIAQIEIERRVLALADAPDFRPAQAPSPLILAACAAILPLLGFALYLHWGSPLLAGAPLAERLALPDDPALAAKIAPLKALTEAEPQSAAAWRDLGAAYLEASAGGPAAHAYAQAIALGADDAAIHSAYGQALVLAEGGAVSAAAAASFEKALAQDPDEAASRFFLALARAQGGDLSGALADWLALERDSPEDSPWLPVLKDHIAKAAAALGQDPKTLPGKQALIAAEIAKLRARLAAEPDAIEDWRRLARTYLVIEDKANALAALAEAAKRAPQRLDIQLDYADALIAGLEPASSELPAELAEIVARIRALDPENPLGLYYAGLIASLTGKPEEARDLWRQILEKLPPESPERRALQEAIDGLKP